LLDICICKEISMLKGYLPFLHCRVIHNSQVMDSA
jgi:hypothetical protein